VAYARCVRLLIVALAAGCSSVEVQMEDLGPTGLLGLPENGIQIASEPYELGPGEERTRCFYQNVVNAEPIDVVRFKTAQRRGQHHFNIFASDLDKPDGFGRCPTNEELFIGARPIVDGSGSSVDYAFPKDMALRLEENVLLIFQLHSINTTPEPLMQQFVLNLHLSPAPAKTLVDIYGFTNFAIEIPPHSTKIETKDCVLYDRIGLLSMSSHFHQRGTLATADYIAKDGDRSQRLYENVSWDDPDVVFFEDAIRIEPGDTIRFACHYDNSEEVTVTYGPSVQDEMCFVFGYYFPKVGLIPCF
jgi:hypothetical protein